MNRVAPYAGVPPLAPPNEVCVTRQTSKFFSYRIVLVFSNKLGWVINHVIIFKSLNTCTKKLQRLIYNKINYKINLLVEKNYKD